MRKRHATGDMRQEMQNHSRRGLTIIEIVIAIALLAIITTVGLVIANPGKQLAKSRNTQRELHLQAILSAIRQNIADTSGGAFGCATGALPTSTKKMASGGGAGTYDIVPCLVPTYLPTMPFDPSASGAHYAGNSDYDSGYNVVRNASTTQVTVSAPSAELGATISITR